MIKLSNEVFFSSKLKRLISLLRDIECTLIFFSFFLIQRLREIKGNMMNVTQSIVTLSEKLYYILERRYNF